MYKVNYTFVLETDEGRKKYFKGDIITKEDVVKYGLESFVSKVKTSDMCKEAYENASIV